MQLKLDKSKYFSAVIGERLPDDPNYKVAYWQDGLPFDVSGELVPDDGKTAPWNALNVEQKPVVHHPLWNDLMRRKMATKLERMQRVTVPDQIEAATAESPEEVKRQASREVDLTAWAKGEIRYETWAVLMAASDRFHKKYKKTGELVKDLVEEHDVVRLDELCPALKEAYSTSIALPA
jgi:hypothetical protein